MSRNSEAKRRAFAALHETCPKVDGAAEHEAEKKADEMLSILKDFAQQVADACKKVGTEPLRETLVDAFEELIEREEELKESEAELSEAKDRIEELERRVESLKDEVATMSRELANA